MTCSSTAIMSSEACRDHASLSGTKVPLELEAPPSNVELCLLPRDNLQAVSAKDRSSQTFHCPFLSRKPVQSRCCPSPAAETRHINQRECFDFIECRAETPGSDKVLMLATVASTNLSWVQSSPITPRGRLFDGFRISSADTGELNGHPLA